MYAQRASPIAFLFVAVWSRATPAGELELKLGRVRESSRSPSQAQSFVVSLGEGDFAQIGVNLGGRRLLSKPTILRAGPFAALNWVQRRTNSTWSPKVERGERESVNAFWEEVKKTGAPLIEPIAGDRENMAVTFVWKGTPNPRDRWKCELQQQPVIQRSNAKSRLDTLALAITWYENSRINNTGDQRGSVGTRIKSTLLLGVRRTRDHA